MFTAIQAAEFILNVSIATLVAYGFLICMQLYKFLHSYHYFTPDENSRRNKIRIQLAIYWLNTIIPIPIYCRPIDLQHVRFLRFIIWGIAPVKLQCIILSNDNKQIYYATRRDCDVDILMSRMARIIPKYPDTHLSSQLVQAAKKDIYYENTTYLKQAKFVKIATPYMDKTRSIIYLYKLKLPHDIYPYKSTKAYNNITPVNINSIDLNKIDNPDDLFILEYIKNRT